MKKDIKHRWFLEHQPEVVWEHLTNAELLAQWLMENDFKPIIGHKFRFTAKPRIKFGFDGNIYCQVLDIVPLQRLTYSWKGGPGNGKITLDSVVTWTLTPKDGGTELLLEHSGFRGLKNYFPYLAMNEGWRKKIKARLIYLINHVNNEANH